MASFEWTDWKSGGLPSIEPHSEAKLNVLRSYVEDYICILCADGFGRDTFKITLVDGFAGGGAYLGGKFGSPFVFLQAVAAAEARINVNRQKPLTIDCHYYFVEKNKASFECLRWQLENSTYKHQLGKTIFLHRGSFHEHHAQIVAKTKDRFTRGGSRVIFFLDQCGYTDVDPRMLNSISADLNNKAEFIINFAVTWFTDFISDKTKFRNMLSNLGLDSEISAEKLIRAKETSGCDWRYIIESMIGPAFKKVAGAPFFSPFYIAPIDNHRGYWLLHLAPHIRARSAMLDVHWRNANGHRHFGHLGLNMLTYKPDAERVGYLDGFAFDDLTRDIAKRGLKCDFARVIHDSHADGVLFQDFAAMYCNKTIADEKLIAETIEDLVKDEEVIVLGPKGKPKRSEKVSAKDIVLPCNQLFFTTLKKPHA
ncbi:MAG TPA: three-Cys-motif partner protein TcmP [Verrucomicrobiae bacterium]|jgi:three-Cys-motif partner protein|nr:three-Cys-motif partner protein TcmP [Verrucomicrobiae bacterium]